MYIITRTCCILISCITACLMFVLVVSSVYITHTMTTMRTPRVVNIFTLYDALEAAVDKKCEVYKDMTISTVQLLVNEIAQNCKEVHNPLLISLQHELDNKFNAFKQSLLKDIRSVTFKQSKSIPLKRVASSMDVEDATDGVDDVINSSGAEEEQDVNSGESAVKKDKRVSLILSNNEEEMEEVQSDGNNSQSSDDTIIIQQVSKRTNSDHIVLCDKSIILFVGDKNEQVRKDVIDTIMLAQLAADKAVQKIKTATGSAPMAVEAVRTFFKAYVDMFHHCNWVSTGFSVDEVKVTGTDMSIDKVLIEIIESIGSQEEQDKLKKALGVLKAIPQDDNRMVVFKQRTMERNYQQFLLHTVTIDKRGSATMKSAMIGISTKEQITNVLWFKWSNGNTEVYKTEHIMMLGAQAFEATRPVVLHKLQSINESYINQIEI